MDPEPRNLPELMAYAQANDWTLVDDPTSSSPSEWRGGLPISRLIFLKGDQAVGYEWPISTSRYTAGRRLLRALRKRDSLEQPTER